MNSGQQESTIEIYGIRHHGPGSSRSLIEALQWQQPDCILVECPLDCQDAFAQIGAKNLKPPLAILVYNSLKMQQAIYLPFAEFSPEWQAGIYAQKNSIPLLAIDLPYSLVFAMSDEEEEDLVQLTALEKEISKDPLGYIASLAGYESGESWWDATFEHHTVGKQAFEWIESLMTELRLTLPSASESSNEMREAFMRQQIRNAVDAGYKNIAVVCGAWHVPALRRITDDKKNKLSKSLKARTPGSSKSIKTESIWIPWTYERLALHSGYSAGVISPAWYELLLQDPSYLSVHWLAKAARLLRKHKWDVSAAHVLEASKLAEMLANIRNRPRVGLEELREAALTVLCEGNESRYIYIEEALIVGNRSGKIPAATIKLPLQSDFEQRVKTARLSKSLLTSDRDSKELDLRVASNQVASTLLHQLNLLEITWGKLLLPAKGRMGNFKESWSLKWKPDFIIQMIQQAMFGTTVREAAGNFTIHRIKRIKNVADLAQLLDKLLWADLPDIIPQLLRELDDLIADTQEVDNLLHTWITLMDIRQFGSVRAVDLDWLENVVDHLFPRICIMLPMQVRQMEADKLRTLGSHLERAQSIIFKSREQKFLDHWVRALRGILDLEGEAPYLQGKAARLLSEKQFLDEASLNNKFLLVFSQISETQFAIAWLDGFLAHNPGQIILRQGLWEPVQSWISEMGWGKFQSILPLLRKSFADLDASVRRRIWDKIIQIGDTEIAMPIADPILLDRVNDSWAALLSGN